MKGAFRSFIVPGMAKDDVDTYLKKVKPQVKKLIEEQLRELESAKVIMTLWIK